MSSTVLKTTFKAVFKRRLQAKRMLVHTHAYVLHRAETVQFYVIQYTLTWWNKDWERDFIGEYICWSRTSLVNFFLQYSTVEGIIKALLVAEKQLSKSFSFNNALSDDTSIQIQKACHGLIQNLSVHFNEHFSSIFKQIISNCKYLSKYHHICLNIIHPPAKKLPRNGNLCRQSWNLCKRIFMSRYI